MSSEIPLNKPVPINQEHNTSLFDCGVEALNTYLKKYALQNHYNGSARTYVATRGNEVVGYYTLAYGSVTHEEAPARIVKGLAHHQVPVIVLARLAISLKERGTGLGKGLLKNALLRTLQAADIAGLRAVLVHAKDDTARSFYEKFGFLPSPISEYTLFLLMKDLKKIVAGNKREE
jgi:GNAT superfamily N-acetyltransferase